MSKYRVIKHNLDEYTVLDGDVLVTTEIRDKYTAESFCGYLNDKYETINELIDDKIQDCEQGIEKIKLGEKDSYIVKHDIAIKLLKQLKEEISNV